jgi:hypothetical protein
MENTQLPIDRHSKMRAILIDDSVLLNPVCQDYINEMIDISEISVYYDAIILTSDKKYVEEYLKHNSLAAKVEEKYTRYEELKKKYRFLLLICTRQESKRLKDYYKCEILSR